MTIKYKVWLEKDGKLAFGKGRSDILKALDEKQSLNAAAKKLGMSFRGAWGRIKVSEERLGIKLTAVNEDHHSSRLTDEAQSLINHFEKLEKDLETLIGKADQDFKKLMEHGDP